MLYIFDQEKRTVARLRLVMDCLISLLRQWLLRPNIELGKSVVLSQPSLDAVPSLVTLDGFRPSAAAIINGAALSAILFCLTGVGIRYSWSHVLKVHIREVGSDAEPYLHPEKTSNFPVAISVGPDSEKSNHVSDHLKVDVLPVEPGDVTKSEFTNSHNSSSALLSQSPAVAVGLRLESYVGMYVSKSGLKIFIAIKGDQLSLHGAGRADRTLSPASQTRFSIVGSDGRVDFTLDVQDRVSSLSLAERGNIITAQRQ